MTEPQVNRRKFIAALTGSAAIIAALPGKARSLIRRVEGTRPTGMTAKQETSLPKINFAVIGINHDHIHGQIEAVNRGGGKCVSFFAPEPDLAAAFQKRYPNVKAARSESEILDDKAIQLVVSAGIPNERAPLGLRVMQHGKDYMSDKPGITTLAQLAEVRRVQKSMAAFTQSCTASDSATGRPLRSW